MAMTKAERAEMDALKTKLALRLSGLSEPVTLPLPTNYKSYVNGYQFNSYRNEGQVYEAWSEISAHGNGHRTDDGSWKDRPKSGTSQNGCRLYATRKEALIALRLDRERQYASLLRRIDEMIEGEQQ